MYKLFNTRANAHELQIKVENGTFVAAIVTKTGHVSFQSCFTPCLSYSPLLSLFTLSLTFFTVLSFGEKLNRQPFSTLVAAR